MKTLVTIITVCYNSQKTIERTIKSVVNQTYKSIEYVIIDGQSTDETLKIVDKYAKHNDSISFISEKDINLYDAMNKGINLAKGEIIALLNSDDWYEINTIEIVANYFKHNDCAVFYGLLRKFQQDKEHSIQMIHSDYLEQEGMCHSSCFITRSAYNLIGLYNVKYNIASDFDLLLRMKECGKVNFIPIYNILTNFSMGGVSSKREICDEINEIKYVHGIIQKKEYVLRKLCFKISNLLKMCTDFHLKK